MVGRVGWVGWVTSMFLKKLPQNLKGSLESCGNPKKAKSGPAGSNEVSNERKFHAEHENVDENII